MHELIALAVVQIEFALHPKEQLIPIDLEKVVSRVLGPHFEVAMAVEPTVSWSNVETIEADATTFQPAGGPVDVVTFSYSLTMIPDWFGAIENALAMLRPGGTIGVVDFYVSRKFPAGNLKKHRWLTRTFWPTWFGFDNVFPSPDHVPFLHRHFEPLLFEEHRAKVPYIPFLRTPYYVFVGRKRA